MLRAKYTATFAILVCCLANQSATAQTVYEGFTKPLNEIRVAAIEIGRLSTLDVDVGHRVQKGQMLAHLEDSMQRSAFEYRKLQSQMTGELLAAKAEEKMQRLRVQQLERLGGQAMARPNEVLRSKADLEIAVARRISAEEQTQLRKADLQQAQVQLDRRQIVAPANGIVAEVFHRPGEYISPGDPAILRLLVVEKLLAVFNVPAEDIKHMKIKQKAEVYLRSTSKTVPGTIASIAPIIDGESGTIEVSVALDNSDGSLLVGDRCTMKLFGTHSARLPPVTTRVDAPGIGATKNR